MIVVPPAISAQDIAFIYQALGICIERNNFIAIRVTALLFWQEEAFVINGLFSRNKRCFANIGVRKSKEFQNFRASGFFNGLYESTKISIYIAAKKAHIWAQARELRMRIIFGGINYLYV